MGIERLDDIRNKKIRVFSFHSLTPAAGRGYTAMAIALISDVIYITKGKASHK